MDNPPCQHSPLIPTPTLFISLDTNSFSLFYDSLSYEEQKVMYDRMIDEETSTDELDIFETSIF